jgi:hypothetical protein
LDLDETCLVTEETVRPPPRTIEFIMIILCVSMNYQRSSCYNIPEMAADRPIPPTTTV